MSLPQINVNLPYTVKTVAYVVRRRSEHGDDIFVCLSDAAVWALRTRFAVEGWSTQFPDEPVDDSPEGVARYWEAAEEDEREWFDVDDAEVVQ